VVDRPQAQFGLDRPEGCFGVGELYAGAPQVIGAAALS